MDRESFIAWCSGVLLDNRGGRVVIGDRKCNADAEEALARGETVLLTVGGRVVSKIRRDGRVYRETEHP